LERLLPGLQMENEAIKVNRLIKNMTIYNLTNPIVKCKEISLYLRKKLKKTTFFDISTCKSLTNVEIKGKLN